MGSGHHRGTCLGGNGIYTFPWRGRGISCYYNLLGKITRARDFTFITGPRDFWLWLRLLSGAPETFTQLIRTVTRFLFVVGSASDVQLGIVFRLLLCGTRLCGNGVYAYPWRESGILEFVRVMRLCGRGVSHVSGERGAILNPGHNRGINPEESLIKYVEKRWCMHRI